MTSSDSIEFPFDSEDEYELILGESFLSKQPNTGFHTVRYDFKPASIDTTKPGHLDVGASEEVNVSLFNQDLGTTFYKGSKKACPKDCILVVDRAKRTITLEHLSTTIQLKKIRSASNSNVKQNSNNASQQNEMFNSQEDLKESPVKSAESSVDSSSSSDSDSDHVDEEVARLNASLTEQTTEEKTSSDPPQSQSSSFAINLCKDLELSESGSDSD
ncbi:ELL-associated factor 2-like [Xenia sp. Carnegie-2017]|uniref:ELL-associated factor 2-like n=1 Tax=Xenia sp. Carnegie-2017 TaxID=2897299 RepID=UPI001F0504BA|nr:ELL-associated factor 2-like [Xenia sp. Carnegie-2017]